MKKPFCIACLFCLALSWGLSFAAGAAPKQKTAVPVSSPLPEKGTCAVLVKGPNPQRDSEMEELLSRRLKEKGYRVADGKKQAAIRGDKSAEAALEGDTDAVKRLGKRYGVAVIISVSIRLDGETQRNEFNLFTGTASAAVTAINSAGKVLWSDATEGKEMGYTRDEAERRAADAAAEAAFLRMTR
ncbi:MAG: hypothetical protein LBR61_01960 [Synergistaceae bacterium]|jgi:hypothetical protein|nr:hypothetical protein [Synergistaceae bacterium]